MANRQIFKYLAAIFFCCITCSCSKDFLNFPVSGIIVKQSYVKDLRTSQEFLNGVYFSMAQEFGGVSQLYPEIVADNIKPAAGAPIGIVPFGVHYSWGQMQDDLRTGTQNLNSISYNIYSYIGSCNFLIECANKFRAENEVRANEIEGQALALRAFLYSYLLNYFAQPYNFTPDASHLGVAINTSSDWTVLPANRSNVAAVYQFIIQDLHNALSKLPANTNNSLQANSLLVKGLLARLLLSKGDYSQARSFALEVLKSKPIMKTNYPNNLFTLKETEAIFQVSQNTSNPTLFASYYLRLDVSLHSTKDIAEQLSESTTDSRRTWVNRSAGNWTITKFPQGAYVGLPAGYEGIAYYPTLMRSSEMCLIASECYGKLGATYEDSARYYLDEIRQRADAQALKSIATGPALLDSIYKERRKELAFEGFRMFDLLRWKQGVERKDATNNLHQKLPYPSTKAIAPIPLRDVQLAGYTQNPGY